MFNRARPELPPLRLVRPKRMYEQVAEQIEALIRGGTFTPDARLPGERELAERLGISRPSLREALIALETAGLIETRVGDGTYVRRRHAARRRSSRWRRGATSAPGRSSSSRRGARWNAPPPNSPRRVRRPGNARPCKPASAA